MFFKKNKQDENINKQEVLDDKVDEFINWYFENMVKGHYTDIGEYHEPIEMRNTIEKMAVWYELIYPDYEVNKLMHCCGMEDIDVNEVMFQNNKYVNDMLGNDNDINYLDWNKLYNKEVFINSLPWEERLILKEPRYYDICYLEPGKMAHLHLSNTGYVDISEFVFEYSDGVIKDEELVGLHLTKVLELIRERGVILSRNNEIDKILKNVYKQVYRKEEFLNCVMYRIIERGGNRIGPRRAFLFAKEFNRNIDIPIKFGIDLSDPGLRSFINEYIKLGGNNDLVCYQNYFFRASKYEECSEVTVDEILKIHGYDASKFYSPEEDKLHQKLVNVLANGLEQKKIEEQKVKKLSLNK